MITVAELIEQLASLDPDACVRIATHESTGNILLVAMTDVDVDEDDDNRWEFEDISDIRDWT